VCICSGASCGESYSQGKLQYAVSGTHKFTLVRVWWSCARLPITSRPCGGADLAGAKLEARCLQRCLRVVRDDDGDAVA